MAGAELKALLNAKEAQHNRDVKQPEMKNFVYRWEDVQMPRPPKFHRGPKGRYLSGKYKLKYTNENSYVPRPWYQRANPKDKSEHPAYNLYVPHGPMMITPPSIIKLAGKPIDPFPGVYGAYEYKIRYNGSSYQLVRTQYPKHVMPKTGHAAYFNYGDSNKPDKFKNIWKQVSKCTVDTGMLRETRTNPDKNGKQHVSKFPVPIEEVYPYASYYTNWFFDTIVDDFITTMFTGDNTYTYKKTDDKSKSQLNDARDFYYKRDNEDSWGMDMMSRSYDPIQWENER